MIEASVDKRLPTGEWLGLCSLSLQQVICLCLNEGRWKRPGLCRLYPREITWGKAGLFCLYRSQEVAGEKSGLFSPLSEVAGERPG
jgi:hypothetical protein